MPKSYQSWARICKLLLAESILGLLKSLQIWALGSIPESSDIVESERATDEAGLKKVLKNVTNVKYIRVQNYRYCICTVGSKVPFLYCYCICTSVKKNAHPLLKWREPNV
jgi:hypothetical protein